MVEDKAHLIRRHRHRSPMSPRPAMPKPKAQADSAPLEAKPALTVVESDDVVTRDVIDDAPLGEMTDGLPSEARSTDALNDLDMTPAADVEPEVVETPVEPAAKPPSKPKSEPKSQP